MTNLRMTTSAAETISLAREFAGKLHRSDIVALYGDLGSGKTQFVKGVCQAFDVRTPATSPSFVILNRYIGRDPSESELLIYHFDLYRIKAPADMYDIGYEEYFQKDGICLIEWADMLGDLLPKKRYDVRFSYGHSENERRIEIVGVGPK
jgi:tRNA threonylcarbamoyladenosine biosynthesis protein TsaE